MQEPSTSSFRLRRFAHFLALAESIHTEGRPLRILDLGGEEDYWTDKIDLLNRPVHILLVNRFKFDTKRPDVESVIGDACSLIGFPDNSFDITHSNSVIEHVGRWSDMKAMARETNRLAPAYFVQTPYFWFPVEPHFRTIGFHWLPEPVRARLIMSSDMGFIKQSPTYDDAMSKIQGSSLLDRRMFADLFPDGSIVFERVFGLPKSMMAIRYPRP
jgi:hypothetical protein